MKAEMPTEEKARRSSLVTLRQGKDDKMGFMVARLTGCELVLGIGDAAGILEDWGGF